MDTCRTNLGDVQQLDVFSSMWRQRPAVIHWNGVTVGIPFARRKQCELRSSRREGEVSVPSAGLPPTHGDFLSAPSELHGVGGAAKAQNAELLCCPSEGHPGRAALGGSLRAAPAAITAGPLCRDRRTAARGVPVPGAVSLRAGAGSGLSSLHPHPHPLPSPARRRWAPGGGACR